MFPKWKSWNLKEAILKWGNKVMLPGKFRIRITFNFSFNSMYAFGQSPLSDINGGGERRWNLNQHLLIARMCLLKRKFLGKEIASTEQCPWNVIIFHILWYQIVKYNKTEERKRKTKMRKWRNLKKSTVFQQHGCADTQLDPPCTVSYVILITTPSQVVVLISMLHMKPWKIGGEVTWSNPHN